MEKTEFIKPSVQLTGEDGNIFNLVGIARRALKRNGLQEKAEEMANRVFQSDSYESALRIISEYCDVH
jgi:hypothetical protein